jgi:hypothetical protein
MDSRFSRSWQLFKASMAILRSDRSMVIYPIFSGIASIVLLACFTVPAVLTHAFDGIYSSQGNLSSVDTTTQTLFYAFVLLFYLIQYIIVYFFSAALISVAMKRLHGDRATVGDGFRLAAQRFPTILGYALISATIGMILRLISERIGIVGRIVVALIGVAWNVAAFMVIPVFVAENVGPIKAVQRSVALLKQTWGEQVIGRLGIGFVLGLINLGIIAIGVGGVIAAFVLLNASTAIIITLVVAGVAIIAITSVGILSTTLTGIYSSAIYLYAAEGKTDNGFSPELIQGAFISRRRRN